VQVQKLVLVQRLVQALVQRRTQGKVQNIPTGLFSSVKLLQI
jgi:hypothetical protein